MEPRPTPTLEKPCSANDDFRKANCSGFTSWQNERYEWGFFDVLCDILWPWGNDGRMMKNEHAKMLDTAGVQPSCSPMIAAWLFTSSCSKASFRKSQLSFGSGSCVFILMLKEATFHPPSTILFLLHVLWLDPRATRSERNAPLNGDQCDHGLGMYGSDYAW